MIKQIIMNMYGTMVPVSGELVLRNGLEEFLDKHKKKGLVVLSRLSREKTESDLNEVGIGDVRVYGAEDMHNIITGATVSDKYKVNNEVMARHIAECISPDSDTKPDFYIQAPPLRQIAREAKVELGESALVSDYFVDVDDAASERVGRVFGVPTFENPKNDDFSFKNVNFYSPGTMVSTFFKGQVGLK